MANRALVPSNNQQHNVPALLKQGRESLHALARAYFLTEVAGQAPATIDAKRRDLTRFFEFYAKLYGHDRPEEWYPSVTREFLKQTARAGVSEATLARIYASVRHFARWIHFKVRPFPLGCPTEGIKPPREPEPQWKGLSRADELRLLAAAQTLRIRHGRGTNQALRDHAAIAVLLGSGLRISELLGLRREQYSGRGFRRVIAKGGRIRDFVPVNAEARHVLEEWLTEVETRRAQSSRPAPGRPSTGPNSSRSCSASPLRRARISATATASESRRTCSDTRFCGNWRRRKASTTPRRPAATVATGTSGAT